MVLIKIVVHYQDGAHPQRDDGRLLSQQGTFSRESDRRSRG